MREELGEVDAAAQDAPGLVPLAPPLLHHCAQEGGERNENNQQVILGCVVRAFCTRYTGTLQPDSLLIAHPSTRTHSSPTPTKQINNASWPTGK